MEVGSRPQGRDIQLGGCFRFLDRWMGSECFCMADMTDLSKWWWFLEKLAKQRDDQKRGFSSCRLWNNSPDLVGLCGEAIFAMHYGKRINRELLINGDNGEDFEGVDVKTSTFISDPYLKHPVGAKHWPPFFVLAAMDIQAKKGCLVGWATREELRAAKTIDWGYGPQHSIPGNELNSLNEFVFS